MKRYSYYVQCSNEDLSKIKYEDCFRDIIEGDYENEVVKRCADNYCYMHDGFEDAFPIKILLFNEDTEEKIGVFEVEMETKPVFYTKKLEGAK